MKRPPIDEPQDRLPQPANDNTPQSAILRVKVLIPKDFPIIQTEIEVFGVLLDDWAAMATNDNGELPK